MTSTGTRERPDTNDMIVIHRFFRRESALMPGMVLAVPAGDIRRAAMVGSHFRDYERGLHLHHTAEDELLWPLLLARAELERELVVRMQEQHERIAATLAEAGPLLRAWEEAPTAETAKPAAAALGAHHEALRQHLSDEEQYILPLVSEHLTVAEWEQLKRRVEEHTPKSQLMFLLGAVLEDADEHERAEIISSLPGPARFTWQVFGRRRYERQIRRLRAGLPGPDPAGAGTGVAAGSSRPVSRGAG